ncbi:DUF4215 domain-containing protein [Hyalangium gracile]|uniref:DUF4215 domain-containing protein n=1 Tax=Hyalangium gracile TaxID=394092 RepID=UPI001CCC32AB
MIRLYSPSPNKVALASALVLLALSVPACSKSTTETCSSGLVCPPGWACSADGQACINNSCGDGVVQEGEACDDGNLQSGDRCNSTCTSDEQCGNSVTDPGEACDDGNTVNGDTCSADCKRSAECGNHSVDAREECDPPGDRVGFRCSQNCLIAFCGNGKIEEGEECDDGNHSNEGPCLANCLWNRCGDGHLNPLNEACDDGNTVTESSCPYGTKDCTMCNANCSRELTLRGPSCGDGEKDSGEVCDSGSANGSMTCPYGSKTCYVCNATCSALEMRKGAYCGDEHQDQAEDCDFGQACGTCTSQCTRAAPAPARGKITVKAPHLIAEGTSFIFSDGWAPPITFMFHADCTVEKRCYGNENRRYCCIMMPWSRESETLASAIRDAVNAAFNKKDWLAVSAQAQSGSVILTHYHPGVAGNQRINTTDPLALSVEDLSGGVGFSCEEGSRCDRKEDCKSHLTCGTNRRCVPK